MNPPVLWLTLGWRNLWRNKKRTLIECTSIAGGVFLGIFVNNLAAGTYAKMIDEGTRMGSGHVGIYQKGYLDQREMKMVFPTENLLAQLQEKPEVLKAFPRLHVPGLARSSRDSRPAAALGLDFSRESPWNPLLSQKHLVRGESPKDDRPKKVLMGEKLAEELGLGLKKKFVWMTQDVNGDIVSGLFRVGGLLRTGVRDIDRGTVLMSRKALGELIGQPASAHEVALQFDERENFSVKAKSVMALSAMGETLEALPWFEAMPNLANAIRLDRTSGRIVILLLYFLIGIGTLNTLLMSVMERTREFGMLRAVGLGPWGVFKMVLAEAFFLSVLGISVGILAGLGVGLYTYHEGLDFSKLVQAQEYGGVLVEPLIYSGWDWGALGVLSGGMFVLVFLACLYPVYRVCQIRPAEAMRKI